MTGSPKRHRQCPTCERFVPVRRDGRFMMHYFRRVLPGRMHEVCPGSRRRAAA